MGVVASRTPLADRGGSRRTVGVREIVNGITYVLGMGCRCGAADRPAVAQRG
jgi:hypothetical protein